MPNYRTINKTLTAPTAIERVEMFLTAHGGYTEPITSIRDYRDVAPYERECTRIPLSAKDLQELVRLAMIGQDAEDAWEAQADMADDAFYGPSAEEGNVPDYNNSRYL